MSSTTSENQCHIDEKVESESLDVNTNISTTESRDEVKQNEANAATRSTLRNDTTKTCKIAVLQNSEQDNVNNGVHKSTDDNISVEKPYDSSFFIKSHGESKLDLHIHVEILDEDSSTDLTSPKDHGELKDLTNGLRQISNDNSNQNIENFDNNSNIENFKSNSGNSSSISTDSTSTWSCQQIDKECKTAVADENPIAKADNFFDGLSMTESQFSIDLGISDQASCKIEKSEVKREYIETKRRSSLNNNVSATEYSANNVSDVLRSSKVCRDIGQNLQAPNASTAAEKILEEYSSHKSRLNIPINTLSDGQKADSKMSVLSESNNMLVETKIPRSQKEILTQDLGSMFKNVHGIFSSVSGTLKNAYIVSSSRPNMTQNVAKMLQNGSLRNASTGKIMNDIFEGGGGNEIEEGQNKEVTEERAETNTEKPVATVQPVLNPETVTRVTTYHESHSPADHRTPSPSYSEGLDLQKDTLEQLLVEQRRDITALREQYRLQATEVAEKDRLNKELEHKLELFRAHASSATRAADAAVVRYATAERGGIEARAAADRARASQRSATAELELVNGRLRSAHAEKQRICKMFDDKCHDLMQSEQQVTRLREELNAANSSLKWNQAKLRTEMDAYKESAALAEKLSQQVLALEEQCGAAQVSAADSVRARELEQQLTETQATLILERHERDKATSAARQLCADLDQVRMELATASTELYELRAKVLKLTTQKQALEEEAAELATLRARAALCDTLTAQLEIERARAMSAEDEASRQRARAESGARREAAALEHAARLTADHVAARAACEHHEAKSAALAADNTALLQRVSLWEQRYDSMQRESELYRAAAESAREECVLTAGQMEARAEELRQHLEWERGENAVLKRKHSSALKELNRELQRAIKRCEQLEARQADVTDRISNRTGSISSLNSNSEPQPEEPRVNGHAESSAALRTRENSSPEILLPERQVLIERIVELQRAGARRSERCDFLEEHGRQLTAELKKKTRLVRHLAVQLPAGALTSNERDLHKSELARLGGGSLDGMSLEMALEINRKLQSVLEDSLLKNITLKDNMDTLGAEIARLHGNPNTSKGSK